MGIISVLLGIPALVGMYFTWRSLQRWLANRGSTKSGLYALYIVIALAAVGASPMLFPGNLKYISGLAYLGFVLVGVKHVAGWFTAVQRHETANLLFAEAAMAVAARVANADGTIQEEEKQVVRQLVTGLPELKEFKPDVLYHLFETHCQHLALGVVGQIETERAIGAVKDNHGDASAAMAVGLAVAKADGKFEDSEKEALRQCALVLNLDPAAYVSA